METKMNKHFFGKIIQILRFHNNKWIRGSIRVIFQLKKKTKRRGGENLRHVVAAARCVKGSKNTPAMVGHVKQDQLSLTR